MSIFEDVLIESESEKNIARRGKKWDYDEVLQLLSSIRKKKSIEDIAIEHQRTTGGISAEIRKLAVDYWFNEKKSIEQISKLTGLKKEDIEDVIKRIKEEGGEIGFKNGNGPTM